MADERICRLSDGAELVLTERGALVLRERGAGTPLALEALLAIAAHISRDDPDVHALIVRALDLVRAGALPDEDAPQTRTPP